MSISKNHLTRKRAVALILFVCLVALPRPVLANNGLRAMGEAFEMIGRILLGLTALSYLLAAINIVHKRVWLRVLSILLILPLALATIVVIANWPVGGFIGIALLLFYGFLTYKSLAQPANHETDI